MELGETITVAVHTEDDPDCPFCPGVEEKNWKTWRGNDNAASKLRSNMGNPDNLAAIQAGARPKDDNENRQSADSKKPVYRGKEGAIYTHDEYGDYSDQAHHAISGNQILNGHDIEKLTCKDLGLIEKDTGYSVNNCANGICLPAYPNAFIKGTGPLKGTWAAHDPDEKVTIMEFPMANGKGQVHIGGHDITPNPALYAGETDAADDATTNMPHHTNYPGIAKDILQNLFEVSTKKYAPGCPFCNANKKKGKKLPPPYRINNKLDEVSKKLIGYITGSPSNWKYFISEYAQNYVIKLKSKKRKRPSAN
jgi:hypothetical protein